MSRKCRRVSDFPGVWLTSWLAFALLLRVTTLGLHSVWGEMGRQHIPPAVRHWGACHPWLQAHSKPYASVYPEGDWHSAVGQTQQNNRGSEEDATTGQTHRHKGPGDITRTHLSLILTAEFSSWDPHSGRRELTPKSCPLISTHVPWQGRTHRHTRSKWTNCNLRKECLRNHFRIKESKVTQPG